MPIAEINALRDRFVEQLAPLRIYLFGSYAEGTNTEESDFDFYIVVDDSKENLYDLTRKAYRTIRHIRTRPVDIVVGTNSRFEDRKQRSTIESEVFQKGMLLYEC